MTVKLKTMIAWCVCTINGKPMLWTGNVPVFWLRRIAVREAHLRGYSDNEFVVRRVAVADAVADSTGLRKGKQRKSA